MPTNYEDKNQIRCRDESYLTDNSLFSHGTINPLLQSGNYIILLPYFGIMEILKLSCEDVDTLVDLSLQHN
jgi:hypothetical protein